MLCYSVCKMKWNFGGQTRSLSLHAVVPPEWEFYIKKIWTGLYSCLLHEWRIFAKFQSYSIHEWKI